MPMTSLRDSTSNLLQFPRESTVNISEVATFLGVPKPYKLADLARTAKALPSTQTFRLTVTTDAPLGGEVRLTINSDGSYHFAGSMRATGFFSYHYRVSMALMGHPDRIVRLAVQRTGDVFGTDTPGDREDTWDQPGGGVEIMRSIRDSWPALVNGTVQVAHAEDVSGLVGVVGDVLKLAVEFFVLGQAVGTQAAACLLAGGELENAGLGLPGLGGVIGLTVTGGTVYVFGPGMLFPAVVFGIAAGAVVDAMVQIREMSFEEISLAQTVFGESLDYQRIRLTNLSGLTGRAFVMPALDGHILVNIGNAMQSPKDAVYQNYPKPGQILIHELTHAWQVQHSTFTAGWICDGLLTQAFDAQPYAVGPAGPPWSGFGLEAQAAIVDQWYQGNASNNNIGLNLSSPYFRYVMGNLRVGQP